jgi:hypothetical protein
VTVRERYGNARGLSVAATVSNPMGHHPYLSDSTRGVSDELVGRAKLDDPDDATAHT